jgi:mono/diheme cytochrome c family protein
LTAVLALAPLAAKKTGISGQQTIAAIALGALFVGWALYILLTLARKDPGEPPGSEVELAPNRKQYYNDEELEGFRLDRALLFCFVMLCVIAIALPLYWLREPGREVNALNGFNKNSIERGAGLFASAKLTAAPQSATSSGIHFGCADCHGSQGQGGSTTFVLTDPAHPNVPPITVNWSVPPLNTVTYRFTDDEILQILTYGRAGTPMPAWGINGGGPMDDQQLQDLIDYIHSIQLTPAQAAADWTTRAKETAASLNLQYPNADPLTNGMILFDTNCARCHTKGYSYGMPEVTGGGGQFGPNITNGSELRQFPNMADQVTFVTKGVDPGSGYGTGGIMSDYGGGMPHFGGYLTQQEITQIVEYERTL